MLVYRICKIEEIQKIFNNENFKNIGSKFSDVDLNTHKYIDNKNYMHFFHNKDSIFYLRTLKDRYLCIYDIPDDILNKYIGIGYYLSYINLSTKREVIEYAVESSEIRFEYLRKIEYIEKYIDYEDFLDTSYCHNYGNVIYDRENIDIENNLRNVRVLKIKKDNNL